MTEFVGNRVTVLGAGVSGVSATRFLLKSGAKVLLSEKSKKDLSSIFILNDGHLEIETGLHSERTLLCETMVVSPGIPPHCYPVERAKRVKIPVTTEFELGTKGLQGQTIGITGTNGKTTTASLLHSLLETSILCGNIGTPITSVNEKKGVFVLEVSSFQLYYTNFFRPKIGILLNLAPDHLDWHSSVEEYYNTKFKLFKDQREEDIAILNADDPEIIRKLNLIKGKILMFSAHSQVSEGIYLKNSKLILYTEGRSLRIDLPKNLAVKWYIEDIMPVILTAVKLRVPMTRIERFLRGFRGLPHRLQHIATIDKRVFVNDSKATNPHATLFALKKFDRPVVLLLGGLEKGLDLSVLKPVVEEKVRAIIALGANRERVQDTFSGVVEVHQSTDMESAVRIAFSVSMKGDVVLLSPGCASFDMFRDYKERGKKFIEATKSLT